MESIKFSGNVENKENEVEEDLLSIDDKIDCEERKK